jgi:hypothetical protein
MIPSSLSNFLLFLIRNFKIKLDVPDFYDRRKVSDHLRVQGLQARPVHLPLGRGCQLQGPGGNVTKLCVFVTDACRVSRTFLRVIVS